VAGAESAGATSAAAVLWAACRPRPAAEPLRAALAAGPDLELLMTALAEQRVGPMVWWALGGIGQRDALRPWRAGLEAEASLRRAQAMLLLPHAIALSVGTLTRAGHEPMVFKGPVVAARYPEPGLRPMDDLDLILPAGEHKAAVTALAAAGWEVARRAGRQYHDSILVHPDVPGLKLELHYALDSWENRATGLVSDTLWRRRVPVDCLGFEALTVPVEDELVALSVHAGKPWHTFDRLMWLVDLAMITEAEGGRLDWELLAARAREARATTVVGVAFAMAERLGVGLPPGLLALPTEPWRRVVLDELLAASWPLSVPTDPTRRRVMYALTDQRWRRATLFIGEHPEQPLRSRAVNLATSVYGGVTTWWDLRRDARRVFK
jgi:hypothetical protein